MKKATFIIALLFVTTMINAQNYEISFSGSGESTNVETVFVENLTQGTTLELAGTDILHLVGTVGISSSSGVNLDLNIYPNPMQGTSKIEFYSDKSDDVKIEIFDLNGRLVVNHSGDIHTGINGFEISGFSEGFYSVNVITSAHQTSANFISANDDAKTPAIKAIDQGMIDSQTQTALKSTKNLVQMQYNDGERLLFKGVSGDYARVLTIIPTQTQSVNFEFVPCTDLGGNNYAVVTIGEQTWMAENLKYLPSVNAVADGSEDVAGSYYYVYGYDGTDVSEAKATENYDTYGVLYNWSAAMNGEESSTNNPSGVQGICPAGWHLPSEAEWAELSDLLFSTVAGGKLKETGTTHWSSPNTGATNETGFTALPGGARSQNGVFGSVGEYAYWQSATVSNTTSSWYSFLLNMSAYGIWIDDMLSNQNGFSVRCIKNNYSSSPQADFNANQTEISLGESVQFTDISTNNPTDWQWDFGDGNTSTEQNPSHTYENEGTYTVSLTVSNAIGSDTEVKNDYITVISNTWPTDTETEVVEVTNPTTGQIWMDRNLGATQVATSSTDADAYGDLYQWGRAADGHENRTSGITFNLSSSDDPGHNVFILPTNAPYDWRNPQNDNLWQGVNGINNPCPSDYRLPTDAELDAERESWSSNGAAGAFASPLKLPLAGVRVYSDGTLFGVGSYGNYWSSTISSNNISYLHFFAGNAYVDDINRAFGLSVRCIKDNNPSSPQADFNANQTEISLGESVQFTDVSTNNPTDWQWDFGDGNASIEQNPSHTYENEGTYTVSLTATNAIGSDTEVKNDYITVISNTWPIDTETEVVEVTNPTTGQIWMDRNLGATQVATSSTNADAYGDLYQWGRAADGHQLRTSGTSSTLSNSDTPGHGNFILAVFGSSPYDWRNPQNDNLWQGVNGTNNPCPSGYRLPTEAEWEAERSSWSSSNAAGAFASPLKLPVAGYRYYGNDSFGDVGSWGLYWSSTVVGTDARLLGFYSSDAYMSNNNRALGSSVRCLKEHNPSSPQADFNANQTEISLGESVQFTDISTNNPTDWQWDFGDGNTSTEQNPSHTYENEGTYTVSLTVSNAIGSDTEVKSDYITVISNTWPTDTETEVVEVTNPTTGQIWMDRNLGASQVATSSTDSDAYGDLYQWGRAADGHESRASGTTPTLATSDTPGHGDFITTGSSPYDWRNPQNDNLWQGVSGTNNPCPSGYRLPTEAEWWAEKASWSSNNAAGAFASPLKLPVAGYRFDIGSLSLVGSFGYYWSSTVVVTDARLLSFYSSNAAMSNNNRANGLSVRCIKDNNPSSPQADFNANQTEISLGESVQFTDVSTNNPTDWQWDFGDGNASTEQNPSHTYENEGTYTVSLTVSNALGSDTEVKNDYITVISNTLPIETEVVEVTNPTTGEIWMDRNLGASQAATSSADADAYGDLFQWGRAADGHQIRTSETTSTLATSDTPGHGDFILLPNIPYDYDWRNPQNDNLWQGVNGINNPCPSGYRMPTDAELAAERESWSSNDAAGAFASPLKLPVAGSRNSGNGSLDYVGSRGYYWSSSVANTSSWGFGFDGSTAYAFSGSRANGHSVRCIKDNNSSSPQADFNVNQTEISLGETVQFTDISTNDPTDWQWDFGDGNTSTEQNPSHTYENEGTYTVSLTVSNAFGSDTETKTDYLIVTPTNGTFTDSRDSTEYQTIIIGGQEWMAENLAYLPSVNQVADGSEDVAGSYYYVYGYDGTDVNAAKATSNYDTYGVLYNWTAAMASSASSTANPSGVQGVCPTGWHLPSDAEWTQLTDYLGGASVAGGKLKETGTTHWNSPNSGATNETGFTALPGALRHDNGTFYNIGYYGYWWSATEDNASNAWSRDMSSGSPPVSRDGYTKALGFSVRCVRD
ncbi:MAG: FISUMP domain-containing protein [Bacteroidales bacterium]|jgi:uncharacterized protein (TIGR02145 family)|nr:FISUMP domain-containing protein [Bacteroidales bacterium]